jgi:hypothetical protein
MLHRRAWWIGFALLISGQSLTSACALRDRANEERGEADTVQPAPSLFGAEEVFTFRAAEGMRVERSVDRGTLSIVVLDAAEDQGGVPGEAVPIPDAVLLASADVERYAALRWDPASRRRVLFDVPPEDAEAILADSATPSICGDRRMLALGHGFGPRGEAVALLLGVEVRPADVAITEDAGEAGDAGDAGDADDGGLDDAEVMTGPLPFQPTCARSGSSWRGYTCGGDCGSKYLHCDFLVVSWWQSPACGCQNAGGIPG